MRDRLFDLLRREENIIPIEDKRTRWSVIANIADYLIANGVIVPLVKVGDTVYQVDSVRIYESKITAIYQDGIGKIIYDTDGIAFDERAIGKSIFLTREDAEQALKERGE